MRFPHSGKETLFYRLSYRERIQYNFILKVKVADRRTRKSTVQTSSFAIID